MDFYFGSAEQKVYLNKLRRLGVTHIAVSYYEWRRRQTDDNLYRYIPDDMQVCITAGVARKKDLDFHGFSQEYIDFCEKNSEYALLYDMDAPACSPDIRISTREMLSVLPNFVVFPMEGEDIKILSETYERIGINARLAKTMQPSEMRRIPATLYGSNVTDPRTLSGSRMAATTSLTWLSGRRYGELWIWARGKLKHYTADGLARAVRAHESDIHSYNIDPALVAANNPEALTELAVRSLQKMTLDLSGRRRDRSSREIARVSSDGTDTESAHLPIAVPSTLPRSDAGYEPNERERVLLPNVRMASSENGLRVESTSRSLRQCDSCYLSEHCPCYEAHASCAFELPVKFENATQVAAAFQTLLESQFERIMLEMYGEQIGGQGMSKVLGQEVDRFMRMLVTVKELQEQKPEPGSGAISRAFRIEESEDEQGPAEEEFIEDAEEVDFFEDPAAYAGITREEERPNNNQGTPAYPASGPYEAAT